MPDSRELEKYNEPVPGAAEKIMEAFSAQGEHRRSQEAKIIDANIAEVRAGQRYGMLFAIIALIAASFCAYVGQPWPASVIGGGTLGLGVVAFVKGRKA